MDGKRSYPVKKHGIGGNIFARSNKACGRGGGIKINKNNHVLHMIQEINFDNF